MSSDNLFTAASVVFFIWTIRSLFYWVALWQRASYQLNRLVVIRRSRKYLLDYLISLPSLLTWLVLAVAMYITIEDRPLETYQWLILGLFFIKALYVVHDVITHSFYHPKISARSTLIITIVLTIQILLFLFPLTERFFWLLILDRALFFIVTFFILSFSFPSEIYEDLLKMRAHDKLKGKKLLYSIVIGPGSEAGSYAFFLNQILQNKFKSLLIANENLTPSDVAHTIIREHKEETNILITAIDEVNKNALDEIEKLLHPTIGIAVASVQKQLSNKQVKTFLDLTPPKGIVFIDYRLMPVIPSQMNMHKRSIIFSHSSGRATQQTSVVIRTITLRKTYTTFEIQLPTRVITLKTPLVSSYYVKLLVPAIAVADKLGFTQKQLVEISEKLSPLPHIMNFQREGNGVTIIDNTGNTSYEIFESLLQYMAQYKKQRFIILGSSDMFTSEKEAKVIGSLIAKYATHVLLLHDTFGKPIRRGIRIGTGTVKVLSGDEKKLLQYVMREAKAGDCVAFEAQSTKNVYKSFMKGISQNVNTV